MRDGEKGKKLTRREQKRKRTMKRNTDNEYWRTRDKGEIGVRKSRHKRYDGKEKDK